MEMPVLSFNKCLPPSIRPSCANGFNVVHEIVKGAGGRERTSERATQSQTRSNDCGSANTDMSIPVPTSF